MLQKSPCIGQHYPVRLFCSALLLAIIQPAFAWGGDFALHDNQSPTVIPPDYNTILAEKISRTPLEFTDEQQGLWDAALNAPASIPMALRSEPGSVGATPLGTRFSAGWDLPINHSFTTGPVAQYAVDQRPLTCPQCDFSERPNHDQVASVGWRVDSKLGWITPWAQLSYSHQLVEENLNYRAEDDPNNRQENWVDVSVGAHMPLNNNLAAFASFSQTDALNTGEQFIYSLGVSASF